VVGLGCPVSVWIRFEACEIPALLDAINDALDNYRASQRARRRSRRAASEAPPDWRVHIAELRRMHGDVQASRSADGRGSFDVLWPTVIAYEVIHGAVRRAERAAGAAAGRDLPAARAALAAAVRTRRDFDAVEGGGLPDVWL
jgi:hypothetical protein